MNLIIDIGNTFTKIGIFDKGEIVQTISIDRFSCLRLKELMNLYPDLSHAILSIVKSQDVDLVNCLKSSFNTFIEFNHKTPVPLENLYLSKETLGLDRIATAVGSVSLFPGQNLFVIDAGSAITFDLIDKANRFWGGNISPGLNMRFRALNEFTGRLPLVKSADQFPQIGKTTEDAILAGVQNGMILEIDGMIDQIKRDWPDCIVILTGGDSFFFDKKLKNIIFVKFEITLIGLNCILEYNAEKN